MITKNILQRLFLLFFITSCVTSTVQSPVEQTRLTESFEIYQALYCAPGADGRLPAGLACDGLFGKTPSISVGNTKFAEDLLKNPEVMIDITSKTSDPGKEKYPVRMTTLMRQFRDIFLGFFKSPDYREPLARSFEASMRMHSELTEKSIAQNGGYSQYDLIIAGTGVHGIIALHQALATNPKLKILLVDEGDTAGATFRYGKEVFKINSSSRASGEDARALPGEGNINELPGLPIQVSDLTAEKYPTANDLGVSIVAGLQSALRAHPNVDVLFNARVVNTFAKAKNEKFNESLEVQSDNQTTVFQVDAQKIVIATGLGDPNIPEPVLKTIARIPRLAESVNGRVPRVITFEDFLRKLAMSNDPIKMIKDLKIGIVGKGDSANVLIEFLLGYGPRDGYASSSAQSGRVGKIAWIGQEKLTCEEFIKDIRSRYAPIGTGFRSSSPNVEAIIKPYASRLADVTEKGSERVNALLENGQSIDGLDFIVVTTGFDKNVRSLLRGVSKKDPATFKDDNAFFEDSFETLEAPTSASPGLRKVGRKFNEREIYVVGTAAGQLAEKKDLVGIIQNFVSIFNNAPGVVASMKKILDGVKPIAQTPPKTSIEVKTVDQAQSFIIRDVQESRLMGAHTLRYLIGTFQEALGLTRNFASPGINLLFSLDKTGNLIVTSNNKSDVTQLMNLLGKTREFYSLMRQRLLSAEGQMYLLTVPGKGNVFDSAKIKLELTKQKLTPSSAPIEIFNTKIKFRGARDRTSGTKKVSPEVGPSEDNDKTEANGGPKEKSDADVKDQTSTTPREITFRGAKINLNNVENFRKFAIFNELPAGEFLSGAQTIKFDRPFEMMATTMPNRTWKKILTLIESRFGSDPTRSVLQMYNFNNDQNNRPNLPVNAFTPNEVAKIIRDLNRLSSMGAYEQALAEIFPGHRFGDVYDLPTNGEWDYVATGGGKNLLPYLVAEKDLAEIAVFGNLGPTNVASRRAVVFGQDFSKPFYDLLGNVFQITKENEGGTRFSLRGASASVPFEDAKRTFIQRVDKPETAQGNGFRLVRRPLENISNSKASATGGAIDPVPSPTERIEDKNEGQKELIETKADAVPKKDREVFADGKKLNLTKALTYRDYGIFNRVSPSKFMLDGLTIEIKEPFEMMAAPLTQLGWYRLKQLTMVDVEATPSANPGGNSISPSLPVENITPSETTKLINAINKLSQQGLLEDKINSIFPGHKNGMIYDIPTKDQWNAVTTNSGKNPSLYVFGDKTAILKSVALIGSNQTSPVASLEPIVFYDDPSTFYYDLNGNVLQITKGANGFFARGASFSSSLEAARRDVAEIIGSGQASGRIGVRFVRTGP